MVTKFKISLKPVYSKRPSGQPTVRGCVIPWSPFPESPGTTSLQTIQEPTDDSIVILWTLVFVKTLLLVAACAVPAWPGRRYLGRPLEGSRGQRKEFHIGGPVLGIIFNSPDTQEKVKHKAVKGKPISEINSHANTEIRNSLSIHSSLFLREINQSTEFWELPVRKKIKDQESS